MKREKWVFMGHAGHFIMGNECRFRLNTYVGKYIVSTVGELVTPELVKVKLEEASGRKRDLYEDIGLNRKYETMVFKARKSAHKCCPYEIIVSRGVDADGYNTSEDAYKGHMKLCEKWSKC